jgi:uncharacterized protein (DUF1684 family)
MADSLGDGIMNVDDWKEDLERQRKGKDFFFASHPQSPLPPAKRQRFRGLAYWPPDPDYRFELPLLEHDEKKLITVEDTGVHVRELRRWGEFRFELHGKRCTLEAYKSNPDEDRLFIPFRDATSGKESYGAGRYLDLEAGRNNTADGRWVLDFNEAYNPWCAYSSGYVCPFTPPDNWLAVAIRAGERKCGDKTDSSGQR